MNEVARVLGVQLDIRELEDIQTCALLYPPSMRLRNIETVGDKKCVHGSLPEKYFYLTWRFIPQSVCKLGQYLT